MIDSVKRKKARRILIFLALLFILPVIIAYSLFYSGWRPSTTGNYGELLQPARPIADVALVQLDGSTMRFHDLRGKWTLLTFATSECLTPCQQNLQKMVRVIAAQGEEAARAQSVLITTDAKARDWLKYAVKDYPGLRAIIGPPTAVAELARQFVLPAGSPLDNLNRVYLVDPLGNFMMSYGPDANPTGLRKDLKRLLRVSRIG